MNNVCAKNQPSMSISCLYMADFVVWETLIVKLNFFENVSMATQNNIFTKQKYHIHRALNIEYQTIYKC